MVNELINGRRGAVQIATPTEQIKMTFAGNKVFAGKHLVLTSAEGKTLNIVPAGSDFVFKNEVGATLVDQNGILGKAGQPVRLGLAQLQEALRNPDKLRGLFSTGVKVLIIALAVWLGAKIGLVVLAALAWVAFLGILIGLFSMAFGPAVQAFKLLLLQAGISEKDLTGFLKKAGEIAKAVIAETISELRNNKLFAQ